MTDSRLPLADRLQRIASLRTDGPSDPAVRLGSAAEPPITDAETLDLLSDALSGDVAALPPVVADRLTTGLGLPRTALDPAADFAPVETDLLREFLGDRGVVDVRSCRGPRGRSALLTLVGLVDRCATGPAAAGP